MKLLYKKGLKQPLFCVKELLLIVVIKGKTIEIDNYISKKLASSPRA
jgi:hypothetical protein